ncbi:MAG: CYTH domain-containing protein [DPANN group archaeon]|nr:CYTH domain-containing protein [DPANN group archaeon]
MNNIEVEIRSFISKEQFEELKTFMNTNAEFIEKDVQKTTYFTGDNDLRLQQNCKNAKIILKNGQIHDDYRKEIEVIIEKTQYQNMMDIFETLGYSIEIQWFRKRLIYLWKNVTVTLDNTKGYGYIIELEYMCSEENKETKLQELKKLFFELDITETKKEIFNQKFNNYRQNWKELIKKG